MTSGPNIHGSMEKLLEDMRTRITLLERRLARPGGGGGGSGTYVTPPGGLMPYGGGAIPSGYLEANGAAVSRVGYLDLFNAIGTTFGAGDGSTTFNLPDLRGRVPVGLNASDPDFTSTGQTGGEKEHTLTGAELPPVAIETKAHGYTARSTTGQYNVSGLAAGSHRVMFNDGNDTTYDGDYRLYTEGGGGPHNNLQPYLTLRWLISTGGGTGTPATDYPPLPTPRASYGPSSSALTSTVFEDVPSMNAITMNFPLPCYVRIDMQCVVAPTNTAAYTMLGATVSGATAVSENEGIDVTVASNLTPFSYYTGELTGSKIVLVAAGDNTFTLRRRRSSTSGSNGTNYALMNITPISWVGAPGPYTALQPFTQFQSGLVTTASSVAAGSSVNQTVTFPVPFSSTPIVMLTNQQNGRPTLSANSITNTDFVMSINNWSSGTLGAGQTIAWQAYTL